MRKKLFILIGFSLSVAVAAQKAPKPPLMGWSSWNTFRANINEEIIKGQADALVATGLASAGYRYVNIDDGFFNGRDAEGNIRINTNKFPNGMKAVADYIHSKGLKAGMYGDAGPNTCASIWETPKEVGGIGAGFYNHEQQDMNLYFKTWGFDFLKVDYCGASQQDLKLDEQTQYTKIKKAIDATGVKNYVFNVCRWDFPGTWVTRLADSWRISYDINPTFERMAYILDLNTFLAPFMSPGHYNDMDMLEIGNGTSLTYEENKAQMSLWCVLSSPLVLGTNLNKISQQTLDIVKNTEAIAVNQDMTEQGRLVSDYKNPLQVWAKKLRGKQSGQRAVVLFNRSKKAADMTLHFADADLSGSVQVRDLWAKKNLGLFKGSFTVSVPSHGVVMLRLKGTNLPPREFEAEYAYLNNFNHLKDTKLITDQACVAHHTAASRKAIVTSIGGNAENYIEFRDIYVKRAGRYPLTISYLCDSQRSATVVVNGKPLQPIAFQPSSTGVIAMQTMNVELKKGINTIRFENTSDYMPDLDKISLNLNENNSMDIKTTNVPEI